MELLKWCYYYFFPLPINNASLEKHYDIVPLSIDILMLLNRLEISNLKFIIVKYYYRSYGVKSISPSSNYGNVITMDDDSSYIGLSNVKF